MGRPITPEAEALRDQLEATVLDALDRVGPAGVVKAELIRPFLSRGVDRSTLYRWFELLMESGRPGQRLAKSVETAVKAREERAAAKGIEPAEELVEAVRATLPVAVRVEDLAGAPAITVMDRLAKVTSDFELLIKHAKTDDGKVRNARLLALASAEMRKTLETAVKFAQVMREAQQIDRLHDAILEEIAKEAPAVAERILRRLDALSAAWTG